MRVMVVDDTNHVRRMLQNLLADDGFEVVGGAADGAAALASLAEVNPDVVVLDHQMPVMDGLETARQIHAARPGIDLILYSAFVDSDIEAAAAEIGVSVCVGKIEGLAALEAELVRLAQRLAD